MLKRLLTISRPVYWVGLTSLIWWGVILAGNHWSLLALICFLYFSFPMSFVVFGLNDVTDMESDSLNPRKGGVDGALVSQKEVKLITWLAVIFGTAPVIILGLSGHIITALAFLGVDLFAFTYSIKPRFKGVPIVDSLSNGFWAVMILIAGFTVTLTYPLKVDWPIGFILALFFSACALHAGGAILDNEVDKNSGETTISVRLGKKRTLIIAICLMLLAAIVMPRTYWIMIFFYLLWAALGVLALFRPDSFYNTTLKKLFFGMICIPGPALYLLFS